MESIGHDFTQIFHQNSNEMKNIFIVLESRKFVKKMPTNDID